MEKNSKIISHRTIFLVILSSLILPVNLLSMKKISCVLRTIKTQKIYKFSKFLCFKNFYSNQKKPKSFFKDLNYDEPEKKKDKIKCYPSNVQAFVEKLPVNKEARKYLQNKLLEDALSYYQEQYKKILKELERIKKDCKFDYVEKKTLDIKAPKPETYLKIWPDGKGQLPEKLHEWTNISINSENSQIKIQSWDKDIIRIEATKRAATKEDLEKININLQKKFVQKNIYLSQKPDFHISISDNSSRDCLCGQVDYDIYITKKIASIFLRTSGYPKFQNFKVDRLTIDNCRGELKTLGNIAYCSFK